jgi:hypothetical protein
MGTPQQQAALVGLQGEAVDLVAPPRDIGADGGREFHGAGGFQGLKNLLEGEPGASRPPDRGRSEAIHAWICRRTDKIGKAGEGCF